MLQTEWNKHEKNGVICLVSMYPSRVNVYKLSKKVHFLQFCADLSKKPTPLKTIYIYEPESCHYTLPKHCMVHEILPIKIPKKDADSAVIYQNSSISNPDSHSTFSESSQRDLSDGSM